MVTESAKRVNKWPAWVGGRDRLDRIANEIGRHLEARKERMAVEAHTKALDPKEAIADLDREFHVWARATEKDLALTRTGRPADVFEAMDADAVQKLEVAGPERGWAIVAQVTFSTSTGCELEVAGDPDWVRGVYSSLETEVTRGVPWWGFLRDGTGGLLVAVTFLANALWRVWPDLEATTESSLASQRVSTVVLWAFVSVLVGMAGHAVIARLLPAFEVVSGSDKGRGAWALGVLGTLLASFLINVVT